MAGTLDDAGGTSVTTSRADIRDRRVTIAFALFLGTYLLGCIATSAVAMRAGGSAALISGDGIGYYAWLRSAALDGDLDFRNDYRLLYPPDPLPPEMQRQTARGLVPNKYPVGLALVELPGFLAGHVVALLSGVANDGHSAPYQLAITLWLQVLFVGGAWLLWRALTQMTSEPLVSALVVASALLATNVVHYAAKDPSMAHAAGFALLSAAIWCCVRATDQANPRGPVVLAGALLGLSLIVRPSCIALLPFFLALLWNRLHRDRRALYLLSLPLLAVVSLQLGVASWFWRELTFGRYEGEGFTAGLPGIVSTLFSARHGLFTYHQWYAVLLGLCLAAFRQGSARAVAAGAACSFVALASINGTWWSWWFGDGYGNRAFIEILPVLCVPAAMWLSTATRGPRFGAARALAALAIVCALSNAMLWSGFVLRRYPADGRHTVAEAYLWMFR